MATMATNRSGGHSSVGSGLVPTWHRDAGAQPACNNNFTDATEVTFAP